MEFTPVSPPACTPKGEIWHCPPAATCQIVTRAHTEGKAGGGQSSPHSGVCWELLSAPLHVWMCRSCLQVVFPRTNPLCHIKKLIVNTGTY